MPLYPWPLKEPRLNVYRGKVPRGLLPVAVPQPSSLLSQTPTLLTLTAVPPSPYPTPLTHCMTPQSKQSWAQPHPACPIEELMPALTLIRQWPLAWKRIPVCVSGGHRWIEEEQSLEKGKEGCGWVRFRCVHSALALFHVSDDSDVGLGISQWSGKMPPRLPFYIRLH